MAIFPRGASNDLMFVEPVGNLLQAVANAQYRYPEVESCWVDVRRIFLVDRIRAARENNTGGLPIEISHLLSTRKHLRVDIELSQSAGDEVCVLRAAYP